MVAAGPRSLQCLAQSLLDAVCQLARSSTSQPSQFSPSRSVRRRRRRQTMLRKLYSAAVDSSVATEDRSVQVSSAQGLVVSSDLTPVPNPEGSSLHMVADAVPCALSPIFTTCAVLEPC